MARGINKVILIGNLGGDPDVRYLPNENAVTNLTLATSDSWKDKQSGQIQERTEWHRFSFLEDCKDCWPALAQSIKDLES